MIKNEAILRDFLNLWSWQHQKRSNSARLPSIMESWLSAELTASFQCVLRFFQPMSLKYCACHGKVMPGHTKCCTCHTKSSSQNWRSDAPKCTLLRKSAPWPPNFSDEHVPCTAPAMENASFQILFKCPTPAIVFGHARKPSLLARCRLAKPHLNLQKWSEHVVFFTLWLGNVLRATTASMVCLVHFDFQTCFAPQRRVLFRHLNFEKWSERVVLLAFSLANVLRATTACIFSSHIWPDCSAPAALASLFFDPPKPQIIRKHSVLRLCYLFAHLPLLSSHSFSSLIFSLLLFFSLTLPTYAFPSVHIVGSLTSKLPSMIFPGPFPQ